MTLQKRKIIFIFLNRFDFIIVFAGVIAGIVDEIEKAERNDAALKQGKLKQLKF